jgi:PQQ-like domain
VRPRTSGIALLALTSTLAPFAFGGAGVPLPEPTAERRPADALVRNTTGNWRQQLVPPNALPPTRFAPADGNLPGLERWRTILTAPGATPLERTLALHVLEDGTTLSVAASGDVVSFLRLGAAGAPLSSFSVRRPHSPWPQAAAIDDAGHVTLLQAHSSGAELIQYDGFDGSERWRQALATDTRSGSGQRLILDAAGNALVSYTADGVGHIEKHDGSSGALAWDTALVGTAIPTTIAVDSRGDVLALVATSDGTGLMRCAADDGRLLWNVPLSSGLGTSLDLDRDGNTFVALQAAPDAPSPPSVIKIGSDGIRLWTRALAGPATWVAADAAGDVLLHSPFGVAQISKLSGANGKTMWGPVTTVPAFVIGRSVDGDVILAGERELRIYAGATGALRRVQPAQPVFGQALVTGAGRIGLVEWASDTPGLRTLRETFSLNGKRAFVAPLVAADPTVSSTELRADAAGNVLLVASTSHGRERRTSAVKYDGNNGTVMWGPLTFPADSSLLLDAQGDLIAYEKAVGMPGGSNAVTKYAGQDGSLLWGPIGTRGSIQTLLESADHQLVVLGSTGAAGPQAGLTLSKLDSATGAWLWGPVALDHGPSFQPLVRIDGVGNIVVCSSGETDRISKFDGATGARAWGPLTAPASVCAVGPSGDVYVAGTTSRGAELGQVVVERRRSDDGGAAWRQRLPWRPTDPSEIRLLPDAHDTVLVLDSGTSQAVELGFDGHELWGPVALPGTVEALAAWPAGDVLLALNEYTPGNCDFNVARLDVRLGAFVWGPLRIGECGGSAALDAHGNVGLSALRDGVWHVSVLQADSGRGLLDRPFAAGEWPLDFGGLAFLGSDVVVTGVRGLEGLTARIGVPILAETPN